MEKITGRLKLPRDLSMTRRRTTDHRLTTPSIILLLFYSAAYIGDARENRPNGETMPTANWTAKRDCLYEYYLEYGRRMPCVCVCRMCVCALCVCCARAPYQYGILRFVVITTCAAPIVGLLTSVPQFRPLCQGEMVTLGTNIVTSRLWLIRTSVQNKLLSRFIPKQIRE